MQPTAIVTGGAKRIGIAIVESLIAEGYSVCCMDIDGEALEEFGKKSGANPNLLLLNVDVGNEEQVAIGVKRTVDRFGGVTALVNNAAISANRPIDELTLEEWNQVIRVNLTGAFLLCKYSYPYMKKSGGAIVNIVSTRSLMSEPNTEAYAASKGGLLALNHALAISLGPDVRVNAISPGWIDVSLSQPDVVRTEESQRNLSQSQHPVGRVGTPEDIAQLVLFLLSDKSGFITGQNIVVDGGMTKKMIYI